MSTTSILGSNYNYETGSGSSSESDSNYEDFEEDFDEDFDDIFDENYKVLGGLGKRTRDVINGKDEPINKRRRIVNDKPITPPPKKITRKNIPPKEEPPKEEQPPNNFTFFFIPNHNRPNAEGPTLRPRINTSTVLPSPCPNLDCDHSEETDLEMCLTPSKVETVRELINLGKLYHCKKRRTFYGINLRIISKITPHLIELENIVEMDNIKLDIVQQVLYFMQPIEGKLPCGKCIDCATNDTCIKNVNIDMLHSIICGPPGVGKTMLAKVMCNIYASMGILSKGTFTTVRRSDLIADYLGQTASKTQKKIDSCKGGMIFIDEAYSLGEPEGKDSYSKECIDTITLNLTEGKADSIFFIAGYKQALKTNFFAHNEGLERRFPFEYDIPPYSGKGLAKILVKTMESQQWKYDMALYSQLENFIISKMNWFKYNGGDMETLLLKIKITRTKRLLFKKNIDRKLITFEDVLTGFKMFEQHNKDNNEEQPIINFMYT